MLTAQQGSVVTVLDVLPSGVCSGTDTIVTSVLIQVFINWKVAPLGLKAILGRLVDCALGGFVQLYVVPCCVSMVTVVSSLETKIRTK